MLLALLSHTARLARKIPGFRGDVHLVVEVNGTKACGSIEARSTDHAAGPVTFRPGGCGRAPEHS
jgi:hypothetical protein